MVLIKSISGVRGTIHEEDNIGLSSSEIINCVNQFAFWLTNSTINQKFTGPTIAIGRDGRISGQRISTLIANSLVKLGFNILDLGLTTTPSVQMAIVSESCIGGIMISASHNPINWNGLKLLNYKGEFLSKKAGLEVFSNQDKRLTKDWTFGEGEFTWRRAAYAATGDIKGAHTPGPLDDGLQTGIIRIYDYIEKHISSILDLSDVDVESVKERKFKIVVDGINSSGGVYVPCLLKKLGVDVIKLNCNPNGEFAHNPEPLPQNLNALCEMVKKHQADLGIAVDPDVDRLVLVCEDGSFFGEEYTIVSIAEYILSKYPNSSVVSNLSTTMAVKDVANKLGATHFESAVGEINVVELMKKNNSIIGGEGSGGIIFAKSHYGRDALVGIALFLTQLSLVNLSATELRKTFPDYYMLKEKIRVSNNLKFDFDNFVQHIIKSCEKHKDNYTLTDGIKIYYSCGSWAHVRNSNTEPLVRLIIESVDQVSAISIKTRLIDDINNYLK